MKSPDVSIVAPCFNEARNIPLFLERIDDIRKKKNIDLEVLLVDDGSTDDTAIIAGQLASSQYPHLTVVRHAKQEGIEASWKSAINKAQGRYVCFIDADLQYLPEDIWRLYREIEHTRCDIVKGKRSAVNSFPSTKRFFDSVYDLLIMIFFGRRLPDARCSFVLGHRDIVAETLIHRFSYRHFPALFAVAAKMRGLIIGDVEVLHHERVVGSSILERLSVRQKLSIILDILKAFIEYVILKDRDVILGEAVATKGNKSNSVPLGGWRRLSFELYFLTFPLHKWLITRRTRKIYFDLCATQWLTAVEIRRIQEQKLRKMIRHAYYHVPYYRELFDNNGTAPDDVKTIEDLRKIPLLTKDLVRKNLYFDLWSSNHDKKRMLRVSTSGSTGEPFVIYADQTQLEVRWASTLRSMEWTGWRWGDRQVRLWHQTLGMNWIQVAREFVDAWFMRRIFIPAFEMSDDNITALINKIAKHRPVLVDGYAESFNYLAHYISDKKITSIKPRAIITSAQVMPDQVRNIIEHNFECKVYDKYGSREFSGIAYECERGDGHHIVAESYIVEIIKDGRPAAPGEIGEVVITDLNNFCIPLIRYRIGDIATAMDNSKICACGRGLPKIGKIQGRVQAIIRATNGAWLPGTFFAHFFKDYDFAIRQYQVIQKEVGKLMLLIVKGPQYDTKTFDEIIEKLRHYIGKEMEVEIEFVNSTPLGRTGKRQGSISYLDFEFQRLSNEANESQPI